MAAIDGTSGNDILGGGSGDDFIRGLAGNDQISGNDGNDTLQGGLGNDTLNGNAGSDTASYADAAAGVAVSLSLLQQQDTVGAGKDTLISIENLIGSAFGDRLFGNAGDNVLDGGAGIDTVSYVDATAGVTVSLAAGAKQDTGGAGKDTLIDFENLTGSGFNDVLAGTVGNNVLNGGAGIDTVSYAAATAGVALSLAVTEQQDTVGAGKDTLFGFENVTGSAFNDKLAGTAGDNVMDGGAGVDTISYAAATAGVAVNLSITAVQNTVGAGNDRISGFEHLIGSAFNDVLEGSAGNNVLTGGLGIDTASYASAGAGVVLSLATTLQQDTGGAGLDTLLGFENLIGSAFNDRLLGSDGDNRLDGGAGSDAVSYAAATAAVTVSLAVSGAQDTIGAGKDTLVGIENLIGSAFDDLLAGNVGNNVLTGGLGSDTVSYAAASVSVIVSLAATIQQDTVGAGLDTLFGIENLTGSAFNDRLLGDEGDNRLDGGAGIDTVSYAAATAGVTVSLALAGAQDTIGAGKDTLVGFENLTGSGFDDVLAGNAGDNIIGGGVGSDTVSYAGATKAVTVDLSLVTQQNTLGAGLDTLFSIENIIGSSFNDRLFSSAGDNVMNGGAGVDGVSYANATAAVTVDLSLTTQQDTRGAGRDTLVNFENVIGSAFDDVLRGSAGNNTISGGLGNDTLSYANATAGVVVSLAITYQQNTISAGSDTLAGIENLVGSNFKDKLVGDANDNVLTGGLGNDVLNGGLGSDTAAYADAAAGVTVNLALTVEQDTIGAGRDTLTLIENLVGSSFADMLIGDDGNNSFTGGAGNDRIIGGGGINTASYADATGAVVINLGLAGPQAAGGAGSDTLSEIQNLVGSAFGDRLVGDAAANVFTGGLGDDVLIGGGGIDTASYASALLGVAIDLSLVTAQDTIGAGVDTLTGFENLIGSRFNDILVGNSGDNILTGGRGNDVLTGGAGIDTASYADALGPVTANLNLVIQQNTRGGGLDTLSGIENLIGSGFKDVLSGSAGDNVINGGARADRLTGRAGSDTFVFDNLTTSADKDTITDFKVVDDSIALSHAAFGAAGPVGGLAASAFVVGAAATTADQHVIYNASTGGLFYDADGSGSVAAIQFAQLSKNLALTIADFYIIA